MQKEEDPYNIYTLKGGYEKLWISIVEKEEMEVRYNVDIVGVSRRRYGGVTIHMWESSILHHEHCDFMVWTPPMTDLLKVLHYPTRNEWDLFSRLQATVTTASVFTSKGLVRHTPYTVFMENVVRRRPEHEVTACFDFFQSFVQFINQEVHTHSILKQCAYLPADLSEMQPAIVSN